MKNNKKRNNLLILLLLILFIGVGYAMLTTTININGTGKVKNAKWDVHFANIQVTDGSVTPTTAANITEKTTASFAVTLKKPGDFYEFTVDVVNAGTIDAMIEAFSKTPETVPDCVNYTVTWANGETPKAYDSIPKGQTYKMKVRVEMLKDITADQLLTEEEILSLAIQLDCVQATGEAQQIVMASYMPKYFAFESGEVVPTTSSTQDYTALGRNVFVGLAENGKKSVCTLATETLECFQNNNVAEEQEHIKEVFGEANCTSNSSNVSCRLGDFYCNVSSTGNVTCDDYSADLRCIIYSAGIVICGE